MFCNEHLESSSFIMRFFQRGEVADTKVTFLDSEDNQPMDVDSPTYRIAHFEGPVEVVDVTDSVLTKVVGRVGEYIINWDIPLTALENETYFVTATGIHPVDLTITIIEDFFRVLPRNFFAGGIGGGSGIVAIFSKP